MSNGQTDTKTLLKSRLINAASFCLTVFKEALKGVFEHMDLVHNFLVDSGTTTAVPTTTFAIEEPLDDSEEMTTTEVAVPIEELMAVATDLGLTLPDTTTTTPITANDQSTLSTLDTSAPATQTETVTL